MLRRIASRPGECASAAKSALVERFVWRVLVPLVFSLCIVLTIGAAFDRGRALMPDGFIANTLAGGVPDSWHVGAVVPGSAADRSGIRAGDIVRYEAQTPGQRVLQQPGDIRHVVNLRTGRRLTVALRVDPDGWTVAKHFTFAAAITLELAGFAILLLRPNLLVARALAVSVVLSNVGSFGGVAHWTGNASIATFAILGLRMASALGIAALGFVALGLSDSIGAKRRMLAYATIALGVFLAFATFLRAAIYVATGNGNGLGLTRSALSQGDVFVLLLGFVSVASIALQARGLERRRGIIIATSIVLGNLNELGQAFHPHFVTGVEQVLYNVALLLEAGGLAYAVLVDDIFDIGFVLNRAVVVGTVTALLLPAFVGIEWATQKLAESSGRFEGAAVSLALTIAIALSVRRLHAWVDRVVDRLLFAARHRAANAVTRFADEVALFREPHALVGALLDTLVTFTRIDRCEMLLADHDEDLLIADSRGLAVAAISSDHPVVVRLKSSRSWVSRATFPLLADADLAFPMVVRGRLIGALLCALPPRAEPLSPEEFEAITYLMREAGATLVAMEAADAHRLREENLALQSRLALRT